MFQRLFALGAVSALFAMAPTSFAQTASAPAASSTPAAVAPAAASAAAPAPAAVTAAADVADGKVAFYGRKFNGHRTASGERFSAHALTMAHKSLPFGTLVRITNTANHRSVVVRVNDRGPSNADRVGDVSLAAAQRLHMMHAGVISAKLEVVGKSHGHAHKHAHAHAHAHKKA